ncbi:Hypothetical protein KVN_LOCUS44 [uncultured virus]|nr:Hypothetical protein KVN_LOCUS44 [uncultured virus]
MDKFFLKISIPLKNKIPKELTVKDIFGIELEEYYDGTGFDKQTKIQDFFFMMFQKS